MRSDPRPAVRTGRPPRRQVMRQIMRFGRRPAASSGIHSGAVAMGARRDTLDPQLVRYNDWRQIAVPAPAEFKPKLPVSVIVPYYAQPQELARTLAALEGQTYPRELFEVLVVDDGSPEPLTRPRKTPLDVRVVRQEDLGFGLARARNTGVRAAAHDVLLFLDADMLPEADWLAAHARWHHAVPDAVTQGPRAHAPMDGVDAGTIRGRPGTLQELFAGREVDSAERRWFEHHLRRTDDLTSKVDDLFRVVVGSNLGVRRGFCELVGGFDESFTQWGGEDTEFGYRVWTRGGLLIPVRDAFTWHQGLREHDKAEKDRSQKLQLAKLAHLIANPGFRTGPTGRIFTVPQYVVTIEGGDLPAERLLETVERVLAGPMHDLVVRLALPGDRVDRTNRAEPAAPAGGGGDRAWLERQLGPDPRVRVAPSRPALEEFPASPFHIALPAGRPLHRDVVRRLRAELGTGVIARSVFADDSRASIARVWALHRAARTPWEVADFGDVVAIPPGKLARPAPATGSAGPAAAPPGLPATGGAPPPRFVWCNDWRQVAVPTLGEFTPRLPVSVIVSYYAQPRELARTLAALEGQTYPRELFEVLVVDDGSPEPLTLPRKTPLDVKVVRQEDLGFGLARARNTGVRAAAHDVLLFLDADMLPEADWLAAHARWHHAVPDAVTQGLHAHLSVDGVDAGAIRSRPGTLKELFAGREVDPAWFEDHLIRTNDLTTEADDLFRVVTGNNLGVRRGFCELVGGFDESFTQWGGEDTEFGYRACTRGGLLIPERGAFAWHQGPWEEGRAEKDRSRELQRAKLAHLIAHAGFRTGLKGRTFTVPQYVVTIEGGHLSAKCLLDAVERVLSGSMHDLVVRLELSANHADREWLERQLGPDPRVRVAPSRPALEEFPASPFHVALPAQKLLRMDAVRRLRMAMGTAVIARSVFPDGCRASIVRAWALHRAARTPWGASDFGQVVTIPPRKLRPPPAPGSAKPAGAPATGDARQRASRAALTNLRTRLRQVDGPAAAWRFARWFASAASRRILRRFRPSPAIRPRGRETAATR